VSDTVSFSEKNNFFLITIDGALTADRLNSCQSYLYSSSSYSKKPNVIWDLRKSKGNFGDVEIREMVTNTIKNRVTDVSAKVAIISTELPWLKEHLEKFIDEAKSLPINFSVFHDLENAMYWVNNVSSDSPFI